VICSTVVRVVGPPGLDYSELVRGLPETALLVPNPVYVTAVDAVRAAADPYRSFQYALDLAGVERARPLTNGRGVRVALLDSAPQSNHRDLGAVRILDLLDGREPPTPALHGSLMAGVVGAIEGNGFGIAGVAPGVEILAIPVCRGDAYGTADACDLFDLLVGVDMAWENGAQIVNLSLVGPPNPLLSNAMDRLEALGILVVAAAGNEGTSDPRFPAAYASVIGVGAVDRDGKLYARGNQGVSVDVLAPGVEILSTVPGDRFAFGDGTSLAAAHVSGLLALAVATGGDLSSVRRAFFAAARARAPQPHSGPPPMPAACDVLAELGRPCPSVSGAL
jgi:thermitase